MIIFLITDDYHKLPPPVQLAHDIIFIIVGQYGNIVGFQIIVVLYFEQWHHHVKVRCLWPISKLFSVNVGNLLRLDCVRV